MSELNAVRTAAWRRPSRQWLRVELSAYVVVALSVVTAAYMNHNVSAASMLTVWTLAGWALFATVRGIYRSQVRS